MNAHIVAGQKTPPRKIVVDGHREGRWKPGVFLVVDEDRCNSHFNMFTGPGAKERAERLATDCNQKMGLKDC